MKFSILVFLAMVSQVSAGSGDLLQEGSLGRLHELMQARKDELVWKESIPWRTDLWEARREAAAAGKPIYLWEMDGHPLGCT